MPGVLLDSDVCIDLLGRRGEGYAWLRSAIVAGDAAISVISYGEVLEGSIHSKAQARRELWQTLADALVILDVTKNVSEIWAEVRGWLRGRGETVSDNDLLIASTALLYDKAMVTRNAKHFARVPGIELRPPG
jgi:predicted nucleic acid-binding protein